MAEGRRSRVNHQRRSGRWRPLAKAAIWLYAIHIRELALPGVPVVYRWILLRIPASPVVFLLSIPVAIAQPVLAQYLWLLALFSALMIRRLEPPEPEPTTAEREPR